MYDDYRPSSWNGLGRVTRFEHTEIIPEDPVKKSRDHPGELVFQVTSQSPSTKGHVRVFSWLGTYPTAQEAIRNNTAAVINAGEIMDMGSLLSVYLNGQDVTETIKAAIPAAKERERATRNSWRY